jgi:hypothetical protein
MSSGFDSDSNNLKVNLNANEVNKLIKKYKKIKKYMKSNVYKLKVMGGNEEIVSDLLKDQEKDE